MKPWSPTPCTVGGKRTGTACTPRSTNSNARFSLPRLELEDFKRVFELQRRLGIGSEVLFLPNTYSLQETQRRGFLGRLRELSALESVTTNVRSVSFHIGETL